MTSRFTSGGWGSLITVRGKRNEVNIPSRQCLIKARFSYKHLEAYGNYHKCENVTFTHLTNICGPFVVCKTMC